MAITNFPSISSMKYRASVGRVCWPPASKTARQSVHGHLVSMTCLVNMKARESREGDALTCQEIADAELFQNLVARPCIFDTHLR